MHARPIMDAGPGLNFFSIHQERLLFRVLGPLCVPQIVEEEILRKAQQDPRFSAAQTVWGKLPPKLMEILPDDATDELAAAVTRITGTPFSQRVKMSKDLGETMVIAHAVVAAEAGNEVIILIDERSGTQIAAGQQRRLERLRAAGSTVGRIGLVNTPIVLKKAATSGVISGKSDMRSIYERLRGLDDGLPPIDSTGLLSADLWKTEKKR